ncbi:hypothetical protein BsWGS_18593 [Bradybaena similaris]
MKHPEIVASLCTALVGLLLIVIGGATPQWAKDDLGRYAGLFDVCGPDRCVSYLPEGGIAAAKALVAIGLLLSLIPHGLLLRYYFIFIRRDTTHMVLPIITASLHLGAAGVALIGCIVFATSGKSVVESAFNVPVDLGYSFALTTVGSILYGVTGALTLVHRMALQNPT